MWSNLPTDASNINIDPEQFFGWIVWMSLNFLHINHKNGISRHSKSARLSNIVPVQHQKGGSGRRQCPRPNAWALSLGDADREWSSWTALINTHKSTCQTIRAHIDVHDWLRLLCDLKFFPRLFQEPYCLRVFEKLTKWPFPIETKLPHRWYPKWRGFLSYDFVIRFFVSFEDTINCEYLLTHMHWNARSSKLKTVRKIWLVFFPMQQCCSFVFFLSFFFLLVIALIFIQTGYVKSLSLVILTVIFSLQSVFPADTGNSNKILKPF